MLDINKNGTVCYANEDLKSKSSFVKKSATESLTFELEKATSFLTNISLFGRTSSKDLSNAIVNNAKSTTFIDISSAVLIDDSDITLKFIQNKLVANGNLSKENIVSSPKPHNFLTFPMKLNFGLDDLKKNIHQKINKKKRLVFFHEKQFIITLFSFNFYIKNEPKSNIFESNIHEITEHKNDNSIKSPFISYAYLINKEPIQSLECPLRLFGNNIWNFCESATTVLQLASFKTSIIHYGQKELLKHQENERFHLLYPHINITYSKYKSVKRLMIQVTLKLKIDSIIISYSLIYFEKLVWQGYLTKTNRKICAGVCLNLSCKLHDDDWLNYRRLMNTSLEENFKVDQEVLFNYEMEVLVQLEFRLIVPNDLLQKMNATIC